MGYSERQCQLCGVSFNVGRIRTAVEPPEAAWSGSGLGRVTAIEHDAARCEAEGCASIDRIIPYFLYSDGSEHQAEDIIEHIAGPNCVSTQGYSGHRISYDEQKDCTALMCLIDKTEDWKPESEDEDFELKSKRCYISGISKGPPDEFDIIDLEPVRHGVKDIMITNEPDIPEYAEWATPVHPTCFEIFKRLSLQHFGHTDIDGLRLLWLHQGEHMHRFTSFQNPPDVNMVNEQFYECVKGTEYLAAHPLHVPGLEGLIQGCIFEFSAVSDVVFSFTKTRNEVLDDPFTMLSPELKLEILLQLSYTDVANLRLASRNFQQLPQKYFHHLIRSRMPWVWEVEDVQGKDVDWFTLWCRLSAADGGAGTDEISRALDTLYYPRPDRLKMIDWLTKDERKRYGLLDSVAVEQKKITNTSSRHAKQRNEEELDKVFKSVAEERRVDGTYWPKESELKGLRNRRRIYQDIEEIVRRIAAIDPRGWQAR